MNSDPNVSPTATDFNIVDAPIWRALRPEVHSGDLRWQDLKLLADRRILQPNDYVWNPSWDAWRAAGEVPGLFNLPVSLNSKHAQAMAPTPKTIKERVRHEFQSYLIITGYIWAILAVLRLHEALMADAYNFNYESQGRAIVIALVLGKVVLIAEALRLGDGLGERVPAFSIAIRSVLFAAAILAFHACEEVAVGLWHGRNLGSIADDLSAHVIWRSGLLAGLMAIALVPYFLIKEIENRTGQSDLLLLAMGIKR